MSSPPAKRVKLELSSEELPDEEQIPEDLSENNCAVCLQQVADRTMIPNCSHDQFCFECLMIWTEQSRRCPLCSQNIGDHVIHNYRSRYDYQKHFLPPLRTSSPKPLLPLANRPNAPGRRERTRRIPREVRERSRREREEREESDRFERALAHRKWIYRHDLYAKHVSSNSYTRFRPFPTPAQFAASPDLISRTTSFLRRELLVWMDLDVEFLMTFTISLMKAIDIRSESAVKLLAEFLDIDTPYLEGGRHVNAEHFAHEVYTYVRSPYKDLFVFDTVVQYDTPPNASPPPNQQREGRRLRNRSPPHRTDLPRRISRSRSRSLSWSPSGRSFPPRSPSRERPDRHVRPSPSIEESPSAPVERVTRSRESPLPFRITQSIERDRPNRSVASSVAKRKSSLERAQREPAESLEGDLSIPSTFKRKAGRKPSPEGAQQEPVESLQWDRSSKRKAGRKASPERAQAIMKPIESLVPDRSTSKRPVDRKPSLERAQVKPVQSLQRDQIDRKSSPERAQQEPGESLERGFSTADKKPSLERVQQEPSSFLKRPTRNVSLQATVQAHLMGDAPPLRIKGRADSGLRRANTTHTLRIKGQARPSLPSPPSLLSRLSDTHLEGVDTIPGSVSDDHPLHRHSEPGDQDLDSRGLTRDDVKVIEGSPSELSSSMTAHTNRHDTKNRQHPIPNEIRNSHTEPVARAIKSDSSSSRNQASDGHSNSSKIIENSIHTSRVGADQGRMNSGGLSSGSHASSSKEPLNTVSTVNTRLLHKLEEEKRRLFLNVSGPRSSPEGGDVLVGGDPAISSVSIDSQSIESELRARA
ncbi:hypothetical protein BDP27DRAFT_1317302 [Rhodocollybia butyracea]|uniref:RING-type E3 ubiquitin transferase n=1 Tax=Rhodocollybia butyracea TaxID=206335 RepID=A0A9P5Q2Y4_9AGAR|nr:hypothetical protein BDP27DRAFT_1317302 [Rhodocollybia butyracea]